jgi:hypothetical protein
MPMILTTEEERETWLTAPWNDARKLHGPLPDGMLKIVHRTPLKVLRVSRGYPAVTRCTGEDHPDGAGSAGAAGGAEPAAGSV